MSFYNRRNAVVGYLAIKALRRQIGKRRKSRSGFKIAAYLGLGLVSAGILAAALAIALRRWHGDANDAGFDGDSEIVGEYVTAPEPIPAT